MPQRTDSTQLRLRSPIIAAKHKLTTLNTLCGLHTAIFATFATSDTGTLSASLAKRTYQRALPGSEAHALPWTSCTPKHWQTEPLHMHSARPNVKTRTRL